MVFKKILSKSKDIDILSILPDGVILVDSSGKVGWYNDVAFEMLSIPSSTTLNINELIEGGLDLARQSSLCGKPSVGRPAIRKEKELYIEISARMFENYICVSLRDVTQNYKTVSNIMVEHETSKKINKDKNAFLVKLSNELKSPIQSILGFSKAMIDGLGGNMTDKQEKYVKIINKNSTDILYLMDKIIELSKTESNMFEYDFQVFDIVNALEGIIKTFEQTINEKKLNLNIDCLEIIKRTIYSDEDTLKIILQNVLETSINATDIGSINIKISHPDAETLSQQGIDISGDLTGRSYMLISISDTGAGIMDGDSKGIFDPYSQLDKTNKKYIVRSIALASAKNLVGQLKGALWADSAPMKGTKYNIIIPIEKFSR